MYIRNRDINLSALPKTFSFLNQFHISDNEYNLYKNKLFSFSDPIDQIISFKHSPTANPFPDIDFYFNLTRDEESRSRYQLDLTDRFSFLGPKLGPPLQLHYEFSPTSVKHELDRVISALRHVKLTDVVAALKAYSTAVKKLGTAYHEHWPYLIEMSSISWNLPLRPIEDFIAQVELWVGPKLVTRNGDFTEYLKLDLFQCLKVTCKPYIFGEDRSTYVNERLTEEIEYTAKQQIKHEFVPLSVAEFSQRPWIFGTSGASMTRNDPMPKTKWGKIHTLNANEVMDIIERKVVYQYRALVKRERGKLRQFINASDACYFQMSYLAYFWDPLFYNHPLVRVFSNSASSRSKLWGNIKFDIIQSLKKNNINMYEPEPLLNKEKRSLYFSESCLINIPGDGSKFDHHQSLDDLCTIIDTVNKVVFLFLRTTANWPHHKITKIISDIERVSNNVKYGLKHGIVEVGRKRLKVQSGILSGWRLTSILGSIWNLGFNLWIAKRANNLNWQYAINNYWLFFGDDADFRYYGVGKWIRHAILAARFNYPYNPDKGWFSLWRTEFLRIFYSPRSIPRGYPIRTMGSIFSSQPFGQRGNPSSVGRLSERLGIWERAGTRYLLNFETLSYHMLTDLHRSSGFSKKNIIDWINTPVFYGGGGWSTELNRKWVSFKQDTEFTWKGYTKLMNLINNSSVIPTQIKPFAISWSKNLVQPTTGIMEVGQARRYEIVKPKSDLSFSPYGSINLWKPSLPDIPGLLEYLEQNPYDKNIEQFVISNALKVRLLRSSFRVRRLVLSGDIFSSIYVPGGPSREFTGYIFNGILASKYDSRLNTISQLGYIQVEKILGSFFKFIKGVKISDVFQTQQKEVLYE